MRNNYAQRVPPAPVHSSSDPDALENLILEVAYDDGFVAYLNGVEVARSETMEDARALLPPTTRPR